MAEKIIECEPDNGERCIMCPLCKGKGAVFAFINTGIDYTKHRAGDVECWTCGGVGKISRAKQKMIDDGKAFRRYRHARGEMLHDTAKRLGVSVAAVSAVENGRKSLDEVMKNKAR